MFELPTLYPFKETKLDTADEIPYSYIEMKNGNTATFYVKK